MASKYHEDWQSSKKTVLQRNVYMFNNELMSDVSFTRGESSRKFHSHKYVLGTSSAVFYAMFYGNLAQQESTIHIEDTEEKSFEEFLRYLYTDDCKITTENAFRVMYLAKKYLIWPLAEKCCKVLEASIKPDNVFAVLEQVVKFSEKELEVKCQVFISEKTKECVNSESFCNIGLNTLNTVLKRDTLVITELELFNAVLKWVDSECARRGMNIQEDKTARRRVLGDSVYEIRFLEMSQEDFAKYVSTTGILTDTEIVSIFQKFSKLDVTCALKWKQGKRRARVVLGVTRITSFEAFTALIGLSNFVRHRDPLITLTVNKAVLFHGVRLLGVQDGQNTVELTIKNETIKGTFTSQRDANGVWGYDVMLRKPVALLPNENFELKAKIKRMPSYYDESVKSSVKVDDIVVQTNCEDRTCDLFYKINLSKL